MPSLVQGTPEWLEFRKSKIGASDAPIIMKESPWKTPYQLMSEKLGFVKPPDPSVHMKRGIEMEEAARRFFEELTNCVVFPTVVVSSERPWQIASLDGFTMEKDMAVEIKCPGREDHALAEDGKVPNKYFPQLQHQMAVCKLDLIYYFSFDGSKGSVVELKRDQSYIDSMNEEEEKFWNLMQKKEMPELIDKDFRYREDDEWTLTSAKWKKVSKKLQELEKEEADLRSVLIQMAGENNSKGNGVSLTRYFVKGNVDYHSIPEIKQVNLEAYRKPPSVRWKASCK